VPKFCHRTDRVAVAMFEQAQRTGESVTMPLVMRFIAELDEDASAEQVSATTAGIDGFHLHLFRLGLRLLSASH
jgi:hypothetical protein